MGFHTELIYVCMVFHAILIMGFNATDPKINITNSYGIDGPSSHSYVYWPEGIPIKN